MSDSDGPLPSGSVIGVLGGGQLGRMLALAAAPLGLRTRIYCQSETEPAAHVSPLISIGAFDDLDAVRAFAQCCDVVTTEFENVPVAALEAAAEHCAVAPLPLALEVAQDRLTEKTFIAGLGIAVAPFASVDSAEDLLAAAAEHGLPGILKTRRLGYDGKGQVRLGPVLEAAGASEAIDALAGSPAIYEALIDFDHEISVLVVRDRAGNVSAYDPPRNEHRNGILHTSTVPSRTPAPCVDEAVEQAAMIANALDYVGVLGVEFFVVGDDSLIVNEIAPRVHNSGHWTIDACVVSQFENHVRAVAGWPIGATRRHSDATMTNLIGDEIHDIARWAHSDMVSVHDYGKTEARPGRKMGHVTAIRPRT